MKNKVLLFCMMLALVFFLAVPVSAGNSGEVTPSDSGWILASQAPAGAKITAEKWTYNQKITTESQSSSLSGWTSEGSYWKQSGSGTFNYANFPSSSYYPTSDQYYRSYQKSAYTSYETSTAKRVASTSANGYIFYHYAFPDSYSDGDNLIGDYYGEWGPAHTTQATIWESFYSTSAGTASSYRDAAGTRIVYKFPGHSNHSYWWFRLDVRKCTYTDYVKTYKYYKWETKESSSPVTASANITNVQHWVKVAGTDTKFSDVPDNSWYKDYVYELVGEGILSGRPGNIFDPEGNITRAEFAKILACMSGESLTSYNGSSKFTDCTNHWAKQYINWAAAKGIVSGVGNNKFAPDQKITREALCTMVWRYAKYKGIYPAKTASGISFSDDSSISSWAREAVYIMQKAGVINGKGNNCFDPKGNAKRNECSKVICCYRNCKNDTAANNNLKKLRDYVAKDSLDCQFFLADITHDGLDDVCVLRRESKTYLRLEIYTAHTGKVECIGEEFLVCNEIWSRGYWLLRRPEGAYIVKHGPYKNIVVGDMYIELDVFFIAYSPEENPTDGFIYRSFYQDDVSYQINSSPPPKYFEIENQANIFKAQSTLIANSYDPNTPNDAYCIFNYTPSSFSETFSNIGQ